MNAISPVIPPVDSNEATGDVSRIFIFQNKTSVVERSISIHSKNLRRRVWKGETMGNTRTSSLQRLTSRYTDIYEEKERTDQEKRKYAPVNVYKIKVEKKPSRERENKK